MMSYEPSCELVEWGLGFFENPVPRSEYFSGHEQYRPYEADRRSDEIIARLLQAADHSPEPDHAPSWFYCQPSHSVYHEYESCGEEMTDSDAGRSGSCREDNFVEQDKYFSSDTKFDEQVGQRLNQMIPVPHVPRINGEVPSTEEASSDYERLSIRLDFCGLSELQVRGDGNCQFRALSDQLFRSPEHHELVRQQIVNQLQSQRDDYEGYVPMDYSDYLKKTRQNGAWGDHVTLQAAADLYGVKIVVVTSFKDTYYLEILPKVKKSERVLYLSFWAEVHYNSIYPQHQTTDLNTEGLALTKSSKKRWWSFTTKR